MTTIADSALAATASVAGTTAAWFTLAGALGGVLLTSIVGVVTVLLNHRWQARGAENQRLLQHGMQVRLERRESYVAYWRTWNRLTDELRKVEDMIRELPPGVVVNRNVMEPVPPENAGAALSARDLIAKASDAELGWRIAADTARLTAGPDVTAAIADHIAVTEQKLAAAWEGRVYDDADGTAYKILNEKMQTDLLSPGRADQWAPGSVADPAGAPSS
jgi:hypothetical protein